MMKMMRSKTIGMTKMTKMKRRRRRIMSMISNSHLRLGRGLK
jgi:hypothetical protein